MKYEDQLVRRRRLPNEVMHRSFSIKNQCRECRGWEGDDRSLAAEVEACPNAGCSLYHFRSTLASKKRTATNLASDPPEGTRGFDDLLRGVKFYHNRPSNRHYSTWFGRGHAIQEFCRRCMCVESGERDVLRGCVSTECHLYPWRLGTLDDSVLK